MSLSQTDKVAEVAITQQEIEPEPPKKRSCYQVCGEMTRSKNDELEKVKQVISHWGEIPNNAVND